MTSLIVLLSYVSLISMGGMFFSEGKYKNRALDLGKRICRGLGEQGEEAEEKKHHHQKDSSFWFFKIEIALMGLDS